MLYNVYKYEKNLCLIIWDLGLATQQIKVFHRLYKTLKYNRPDIEVIYSIFNYSKYPTFFNIKIEAGQYAWKPIIISTTYYTYRKPLLWLDAGCNLVGSLHRVYKEIIDLKIWTIGAGKDVRTYTHISTLIYLKANRSIWRNIM